MTTTTTDDASFCFVFVLTTKIIKLITNDFHNTDNDNQGRT